MRIISVIESTNEIPVLSIESFGIFEEQLKDDVVAKAEKLFIEKAVENSIDEVDAEESLDDGYCEKGSYTVSIVWSDIQETKNSLKKPYNKFAL